ncbi:LLM class flavin-dependent oxidoreductase [Hyphomicrobium sp. MC1]|uniref:LLM class flavin-dependent oxidoreductase n=1 Tax=Hyphomicrobium sp. (strain MC1) TaxID=717785 RepID=UPI000213E926|nr:LLM class flavin-dependent oxidoreductase [Hyphomicrobium sp. MC1]CCB66594.1 putative flavin-dependent oxidoreductase; putative monooxygenase [Hyphomicrobium sp. MC1]
MSDLILNAAVLGVGMHLGAWRHRPESPTSYVDLDFYREIARLAEDGRLHAIFLADTLAVSEENFERPNLGAMDPTTVLGALAAVTKHVGLVATATTSYSEPYNLARRIASLDHLSRGRAAWNIVTTFIPDVAANFSKAPLPPHAERYARAEEFVDIVTALWDSWEDGALVGDKASGLFADRARVHPVNHDGNFFAVRGPSTLPRSPQGRPILFQAGSSEQGRTFAARVADAIFAVQNTLPAAIAFRDDLRQRAEGFGRDPNSLKILPGLLPIIGGTEEEAQKRKKDLDELAGDAELRKLASRVGVAVSELDLDKPLPIDRIKANDRFNSSRGFQAAAVELATSGNLTVREILYRNGGGHPQVVGTPEQVADFIESWHRAGAADGFNVMIDEYPSGLRAFVGEVVPLLQKRGVFQKEYRGTTLRENLGLEKSNDTVRTQEQRRSNYA